jgi:hypothetical protein
MDVSWVKAIQMRGLLTFRALMLMPQSEYVTKLVSNLGHEGTGIGMEMEIGWRWKSGGTYSLCRPYYLALG